ncbi:hypothetical protein DPMN_041288 [Dreissena polymorpha]|uniref:Uncharacterized protein n=1 Tax=Dreissena polymorpha TaxID=45954 RepID=A0A9D4CZX7_DREPO|nr:hypothetical protein DPMN_041288 [Dreissena polymorpha]
MATPQSANEMATPQSANEMATPQSANEMATPQVQQQEYDSSEAQTFQFQVVPDIHGNTA